MCPERRVIGRFIMAETGVPCKSEGQILRFIVEDTGVSGADLEDQFSDQFFKLRAGGFVFLLVGVIPFPAVILFQIGKISQYSFCIHLYILRFVIYNGGYLRGF